MKTHEIRVKKKNPYGMVKPEKYGKKARKS